MNPLFSHPKERGGANRVLRWKIMSKAGVYILFKILKNSQLEEVYNPFVIAETVKSVLFAVPTLR